MRATLHEHCMRVGNPPRSCSVRFGDGWPHRPTRAGKQVRVAKPADKTKNGRKLGHVLLVEDDAMIAVALEGSLLDAGAKSVKITTNTADAMAALREHKPDSLVLDVHLADRDDGWALAELVNSVGPKPPRIVFSTGAPQDIPREIAELGPVLEKPYDHAELIEALCRPPREGLMARLRDLFGNDEREPTSAA